MMHTISKVSAASIWAYSVRKSCRLYTPSFSRTYSCSTICASRIKYPQGQRSLLPHLNIFLEQQAWIYVQKTHIDHSTQMYRQIWVLNIFVYFW